METDDDGAAREAREQLSELDEAVGSTRAAGFPRSPRWYWFALAAAGPAAVVVESQGGLAPYAAVVGAAVLLAIVSIHDWRRRKVRPLRTRRSPDQMRAAFVLAFVMCLTLFFVGPTTSIWPPAIVAAVSYGWLVVALSVLGGRLERAMLAIDSAEPGAA